jgi:hypothetical protein
MIAMNENAVLHGGVLQALVRGCLAWAIADHLEIRKTWGLDSTGLIY